MKTANLGLTRFLQLRCLLFAVPLIWATTAFQGAGVAEEMASREQNVPNLAQQVPYPRITLSTCYEVDPSWPQRPAELVWGQTPSVFVDNQDRVWVYTRAVPPVQVYDAATGKLLFTWGEQVFGKHLEGMLAHGIKIDHRGHVWLCDVGNHAVFELDQAGKILRILGTPGQPGCDQTHFFKPTDIAITPEGHVFVTDGYGNARVVHYDDQGRYVGEWGTLGVKPGEFNLPHAVVVDSKGRVYIADRNNARVQVFDQSGRLLDVWQDLLVPWGFWITADDQIWVCGCSPMEWRETDEVLSCPPKDQLFMRFDPTGRLRQLWTVPKGVDEQEKPGELNWVHGIALDSKGNIYACDIIGKRVQKFVRKDPGWSVPFVPKPKEE